ncbi:MAG: hydantoinase B/oxoprolinase family protein [Gemmatimonadales bacterium]
MKPDPFAWELLADTGGTFTDVLALDPAGALHRAKVLSTSAIRSAVASAAGMSLRLADPLAPETARAVVGMRLRLVAAGAGPHPDYSAAPARIVSAHSHTLRVDRELPSGWLAPPDQRPLPGASSPILCEISSCEAAPIFAARLITGTPIGSPLPLINLRVATTRATNALLTRSGARVALFVTAGFADMLAIGSQQRPALFDLDVAASMPAMLHAEDFEVSERISAAGEVLIDLDRDALVDAARRALARGMTSAAVAFMHADRFPGHEHAARELLLRAGFTSVTCSADAASMIKLLPRAQTAVTNAYLDPVIRRYVQGIEDAIAPGTAAAGPRSSLVLMTSAGGLTSARSFRAVDSLLSGPAGGAVGAGRAALASGFTRAISFDMGGTSTDVARLDPAPALVHEHRVADAHLIAPAVAVHTVAAGGGSICSCRDGELRVGPHSAGADPGPACYGLAGPLTITDVNLLLGRIVPDRFAIPIRPLASRDRALELLAQSAAENPRRHLSLELMLEGLLTIACQTMAAAIRQVSTRAGYDARDHVLVAFGGAGGQHACAVARSLGMRTVLVPRDAGLLSAVGLAGARVQRIAERQFLMPLDACDSSIEDSLLAIEHEACALAASEYPGDARDGASGGQVRVRSRIAALRLSGQESTLEVEFDPCRAGEMTEPSPLGRPLVARLNDRFHHAYVAVYGHPPPPRPLELVWIKVIAVVEDPRAEHSLQSASRSRPPDEHALPAPPRVQRAFIDGQWADLAVIDRGRLRPGWTAAGPLIIAEQHGTTLVEPGWRAMVDDAGAIVLTDAPAATDADHAGMSASSSPARAAPSDSLVRVELFTARIRGVALEMGELLRRTAVSVNVKDRLDFSCAILDSGGELIVNAPHVPVHLGSLGLCVRRVREAIQMRPGDAVIVNHPGMGGSHLPDITVITPCFDQATPSVLLGYAASRAHHAEIGGVLPGSMPPFARSLAEEGVVIPPMHLIRGGVSRADDVRRVLAAAPYPSRTIDDNLADLLAGAAANHLAAQALCQIAAEQGAAALPDLFGAIKQRGHDAARRLIASIAPLHRRAVEELDDGSRLCVRILAANDRILLDFTGTSPVHPGNLNATPAIVRSVIVYVLRCLVKDDIPLNEGLMQACDIVLPPCMLSPEFGDDPARDPAVGAGNVETSQRLTDTIFKALGVVACSQGTMNNVIFGSHQRGLSFYETVCGGTGAGPGFHGASAVHSHMTNTRITDPEILETRYPVRLRRFAIRRGSGGPGQWRGGDGAIREFEFLAPMSLAVVGQHRRHGPYGVNGGHPGLPGDQVLLRANVPPIHISTAQAIDVIPGDRLILQTPGGGGWGAG